VAVALAGCDGSRLARSGDTQEAEQQASVPSGEDSTAEPAEDTPADDAPADDPAAQDPAAIPTEGLSDDELNEIETALIDAEALLASIEAELAADE
jgi:hypothetical protein